MLFIDSAAPRVAPGDASALIDSWRLLVYHNFIISSCPYPPVWRDAQVLARRLSGFRRATLGKAAPISSYKRDSFDPSFQFC